MDNTLDAPVQHHRNCPNSDCRTCLQDCQDLADFIAAQLGGCNDWLMEYRKWLDANGIPAETPHGWPTVVVFDSANIEAFIAYRGGDTDE